jgi:O-succinylbenzoic acid--CoA ligase
MNHFSQYNTLTLNGVRLHGKEIVEYCYSQAENSLSEVGKFIEEWLSPNPFMGLKTSGSTGTPKIMKAEKNRMLFSASLTANYFNFQPKQNALLCLPVHYIAGKMMIVRALFSSLNLLCLPPSSDPLASLPAGIKIDFSAMIPMQLQQGLHNEKLKQIKKILLGGGAVSSQLLNEIKDIDTEIFLGYGMTETLSHIALKKINGKNSESAFTSLPGISLKKDERGCLIISSQDLLENPIVTNDLVEFIQPKKFVWKGRFDNVINSGGIKLMPETIESKLHTLLNQRFFIAGIPDEKLGEKLVLIIEGSSFADNELNIFRGKLKQVLDKFEVPKEVFSIDHFAETSSGKINRRLTLEKIQF